MAINFERQFKTLTDAEFADMSSDPQWRTPREYYTAKQAFASAQRTEYRGIGVAFAHHGGTYYVWTEARTA